MVEIYIRGNTNYTANGNITLKPTQCTYKDSENELYLEHFLDEEGRWKYIEVGNVVSVLFRGKKIRYRIYNVVKSLFKVSAYARPIFYDLIDTVLLDKRPTQVNGQDALNQILENTGFIGHSNISTINTTYLVRKNVIEALLGDDENSFINRWGGEFYCENEHIYINSTIGSDNGVRIEFGYNLNEIEEEIDVSEVVTRIIPIGYDGIMLDGDAPWITSLDNVNKYPHPKTRVVEFSDVKVKSDPNNPNEEGFNTIEEARQELTKRSQELFTVGKIDQPLINYRIDMINLSNTTYYKDFKDLLTVNKGDTVTCYIPHLDINVQARVIDFERDMLTGEYISIELGNVLNNYLKNQVDIQHRVNNITNDNGTVKADVLSGVIDAHQTMFRATKDVAQPQDVLGMIFEDRVTGSPTFGSLMFSSQGMAMSNKYVPGTENFDYRTFLTGSGIVADAITTGTMSANRVRTGLIESVDKKTWINLDDGSFSFQDKFKFDSATNQATFDFTGTGVATQDDVNNAKTELRQDYQNAKVTINNQGVDIKDGGLIVRNNQGETIIEGQGIIANGITTGILQDATGKTWINMDDGTFNFADKFKFDGNQATFDFSNTNQSNLATKTDVNNAKNEVNRNVNNTKTELRKDYQNAKVTINNNGIQVNNGAFTLTNPTGTVIIDGTSNIHKITNEGTTVINFRGQNVTATVPHNLGYKPAFSAYQQGADGLNQFTQLPALTWNDSEGVKAIIRARADAQNIYFDFLKMNNYTMANTDIRIKYFIYKEVAF